MARLANTAANFCQRLQELYPQKLALMNKQSEQDSPFRRWTTGGSAGSAGSAGSGGSSYRHNEPRNKFSKQMSEGSSTSNPSNGPWRGRVARWSLGLEQLLADIYGVAAFEKFLKLEYAEENIRFWFKCELFTNSSDLEDRARIASQIWRHYLDDRADYPVNVDAAAKRATALRLCETPLPSDVFQQAQNQIFALLKFDSYHRFLRSAIHAECARADLRGEAPPYGPYSLPDEEAPDNAPSTSSTSPSTSKVKKCASNASDRRRSGSSSLLPWRLRTASSSRDRATLASSDVLVAVPITTHPSVVNDTDVVKQSAAAGEGQSSLCRVVLPDGATSVVEVDEKVTVHRVVDRLLQRRNLPCKNYDVMFRNVNQGETTPIDIQLPSTILGGREAVVERRCVVRIEVGGRCVAVRCRAARRLRHVLRPVLARYASTSSSAGSAPPQRAVLRDGCVVHPETSMQDLDGARLQIVELTEGGELLRADVRQRETDADSLSDLALSVHDDQSTTGSSGRVRAALRPGPPVHHHPPDFLENLRETQRQRLQNKNEPSPAPRTPPPLPPKPSQRAPPTGTVV